MRAPGLRFDAPHVGHDGTQIRLCDIDSRLLQGDRILKRLLVQLDQDVSLVDAIVVIHQNPGNLAADARSDGRHVTVHECVIGRLGVESEPDPGNTEPKGHCHNQNAQRPYQQPSSLRRLMVGRRGRLDPKSS
jgi:hypothetical protein